MRRPETGGRRRVNGDPQSDIKALISFKERLNERQPLGHAGESAVQMALRQRRLAAAATLRWQELYVFIDSLQQTYNEKRQQLGVEVKLQKFFPKSWQPAYRIVFSAAAVPHLVEVVLQVRQDNVVFFRVDCCLPQSKQRRIERQGMLANDQPTLKRIFREVYKCYFIKA
jgi:hypothetical protein